MSPRIAVVVPVLDEAPRLVAALAPLLAEASQVLVADGADALRSMVESAEAYPIRGLFR
jgi:hypothetical protein